LNYSRRRYKLKIFFIEVKTNRKALLKKEGFFIKK